MVEMGVEAVLVFDQDELTALGEPLGETDLMIIDMLAQLGAAGRRRSADAADRRASMTVAGPPWLTTAGAVAKRLSHVGVGR